MPLFENASTRAPLLAVVAGVGLLLLLPAPSAEAKKKKSASCPSTMESIHGKYCIDSYEASVVEIVGKGKTKKHPYYEPVTNLRVKAVSSKGVFPQAYISRNEAEGACKEAGKRLCTDDEWLGACRGKKKTQFPYGDERKTGYCNDKGVSPLNHFFNAAADPSNKGYGFEAMNDPRLNQLKGTVAKTGSYSKCTNGYKVYDMVGNVHEWTADPKGTFRGGYYLDTTINGDGCDYKTTAHDAKYHDYSTGFRCCADLP